MQMSYEEVLRNYGECVAHVTGWSMAPLFLNRESIVRVIPFEREKMKVGDIVLYKVSDQYILHRVLEIRKDSIIACGDNNWFLETVRIENILGIVTGFWRKPSSQFVDCNNKWYQLYKVSLPALRACRKCIAKGKHTMKKILYLKRKDDV